MATSVRQRQVSFDPATFETFRFLAREIDDRGRVTLRYALDHTIEFVEEFDLPVEARVSPVARERVQRVAVVAALGRRSQLLQGSGTTLGGLRDGSPAAGYSRLA